MIIGYNTTMKEDSRELGLPFQEDCPCPYFDDERPASIEYLISADARAEDFQRFLAAGYRRLGSVFYRTVCTGCSSCIPLRVDVAGFSPNKGQRRTLSRNRDIRVECCAPSLVTAGKVELYRRYLASKHGEKERAGYDYEAHLSHIHYGYPYALEMDYFLGSRLVGVGIADESSEGLSSNYFYYDTEFLSRRLGIFSILREISLARSLGKKYLYLGFFIAETPKMSYKKSFRPNEGFENGRWKDLLP